MHTPAHGQPYSGDLVLPCTGYLAHPFEKRKRSPLDSAIDTSPPGSYTMFGDSCVRRLMVTGLGLFSGSSDCAFPQFTSLYEPPGSKPSGEQVGMQQSSLTTGVIQDMILTYQQEGVEVTVDVGSAAWFRWLEQATAFTYHDAAGQFTAQKTHAGNRRGGSYWQATRRHGR